MNSSLFIGVSGAFPLEQIDHLYKNFSKDPVRGRNFKIIDHVVPEDDQDVFERLKCVDVLTKENDRLSYSLIDNIDHQPNNKEVIAKISSASFITDENPRLQYVVETSNPCRAISLANPERPCAIRLVNYIDKGLTKIQQNFPPKNLIGYFNSSHFEKINGSIDELEKNSLVTKYGELMFDVNNESFMNSIQKMNKTVPIAVCIRPYDLVYVINHIKTSAMSVVSVGDEDDPSERVEKFLSSMRYTFSRN